MLPSPIPCLTPACWSRRTGYELSTDDMQGLMALAIVKGYPKYATHELVVYIEYIDRFHFTDLRVGKLEYGPCPHDPLTS